MTSSDLQKLAKNAGPNVARAAYLDAAYDLIASQLLPEAPPRSAVALAFSFPHRKVRTVLGQCHFLNKAPKAQTEKHLIVIAPQTWAAGEVAVLGTLAHEMCHAALPPKTGHRRAFEKLGAKVGLEGKPQSMGAGPTFKGWIKNCARKALPEFPGGVVLEFTVKKQTTRMRLFECQCDPPFKIRCAKEDLACTCDECGEAFELQ